MLQSKPIDAAPACVAAAQSRPSAPSCPTPRLCDCSFFAPPLANGKRALAWMHLSGAPIQTNPQCGAGAVSYLPVICCKVARSMQPVYSQVLADPCTAVTRKQSVLHRLSHIPASWHPQARSASNPQLLRASPPCWRRLSARAQAASQASQAPASEGSDAALRLCCRNIVALIVSHHTMASFPCCGAALSVDQSPSRGVSHYCGVVRNNGSHFTPDYQQRHASHASSSLASCGELNASASPTAYPNQKSVQPRPACLAAPRGGGGYEFATPLAPCSNTAIWLHYGGL
jgi:hypothetical protein